MKNFKQKSKSSKRPSKKEILPKKIKIRPRPIISLMLQKILLRNLRMRIFRCKWRMTVGKQPEFINKEMILFRRRLPLEILWEPIIKFKWKLMSSCFQNSQMNRDWNIRTCLFTLIIPFTGAKWKKLMKQIEWNCTQILQVMVLVQKVHFKTVLVQNVIVWKINKWEMEVMKIFQMIPVWNKKLKGNLRSLCK